MTAATQTVGEIAQTQPSSIRVFEQFGIEYCCGGRKPLAEACAARDVDLNTVIAALDAASGFENAQAQARDWAKEPLAKLMQHIMLTHHSYCKRELPRLLGLSVRVVNRHGGTNPELAVIQTKLAQLADELIAHLAEEEVVVFPLISELEGKKAKGAKGNEDSDCIGNRLASLIEEHDNAGVLLAEIRCLSRNFIVPEYACATYRAFFDGLRDFERDLHRHVHLENNILFPRGFELEASPV